MYADIDRSLNLKN